MTQAERDQRILIQARLDEGKYLGNPTGECKVWVAEIVRRAAALEGTDLTLGGTRQSIPPNQASPMDYLWQARPDVSGVTGISLYSLTPGQIIQMRIHYQLNGSTIGPHTVIVTSNNTGTATLNIIESNWSPAYTVNRRSISYADFNAYLAFNGSYTVYWVK